jgi:hypothetical protein
MWKSKSKERINDLEKAKTEYVEKQVIPWMIAHLQMRNTGLQVFVASQGALLFAFVNKGHWSLAVLGLASCVSFSLWDARNRDVFRRLHTLAESIVDKSLFGESISGRAKNGLHMQALGTLAKSGSTNPEIGQNGGFSSHTWAIRIMIFTTGIVWLILLTEIICSVWCT